ncbi:hypothetical protein J1N35_016340 [Gossypium stocksii]|uniref:F-box/LRR-repeat protein 15/At3g58940/PEG3-like LRR domain-containing protein n=1 Tax=Gossypium stocksii TaxID=47602 RepID=A0A9D3VLV6_9ROSI|nr:hypothetical protein J1N35_016340 [Gossypium stocksii]
MLCLNPNTHSTIVSNLIATVSNLTATVTNLTATTVFNLTGGFLHGIMGFFSWNDGISSWNDGDHDFDVSGWICAALCRGVKEIDLELHKLGNVPPVLFTCHSLVTVLFTCHSLVNLTLDAVGSKIELPSDVCLGNLTTFYLRKSVFVCDSINRLILNCHVLEDLAFIESSVANASELNIQSPSLKELALLYFDWIDHVEILFIFNMIVK